MGGRLSGWKGKVVDESFDELESGCGPGGAFEGEGWKGKDMMVWDGS